MGDKTDAIERSVVEKLTGKTPPPPGSFWEQHAKTLKIWALITAVAGPGSMFLWAGKVGWFFIQPHAVQADSTATAPVYEKVNGLEDQFKILTDVVLELSYEVKRGTKMQEKELERQGRSRVIKEAEEEVAQEKYLDSLRMALGKDPKILIKD